MLFVMLAALAAPWLNIQRALRSSHVGGYAAKAEAFQKNSALFSSL